MAETEWTEGVPDEAGWYIAAVRTNDVIENYYVIQLWFNPESIDKWYVGGGYVSGKSEPYIWRERVTHWTNLPSPPQTHKE